MERINSNIGNLLDAMEFLINNRDIIPFVLMMPFYIRQEWVHDSADLSIITFDGIDNKITEMINKLSDDVFMDGSELRYLLSEHINRTRKIANRIIKVANNEYGITIPMEYVYFMIDKTIPRLNSMNIEIPRIDNICSTLEKYGYIFDDIGDCKALLSLGRSNRYPDINVNIFERITRIRVKVGNKIYNIVELSKIPPYNLIGNKIGKYRIEKPKSSDIPKSVRKAKEIVDKLSVIDDGNNRILMYGMMMAV